MPTSQFRIFSMRGLFASTLVFALFTGVLRAQDLPKAPQFFDIPGQSTAEALNEFSKQSGLRLLFSFDVVANHRTEAIKGQFSPADALTMILGGTGLSYEVTADSVVVIRASDPGSALPVPAGDALTAGTAPAQAGGSAPAAAANATEDALGLEEVIVTAQKRSESMQVTPIAMTAFTSRDLETQRVSNVMDLVNKAPAITLAPFAGTRAAPNLFIRGMGNLNAQSTKDMATGIYIDGVPVARAMGLAADIADLERVELLRGPQGTLWGRNTTAGAINFIIRKPDDEFSFSTQLSASSWDQVSGRVRMNVPVTDRFRTSLAYMRTENDGWVENKNGALANQINFNEDRKKEAVRLAAQFELADDVIVDYGFDDSEMTFGNHFYQVIQGATAVRGRQEAAPAILGLHPSNAKVFGHNLTFTWDPGDIALKSISAYREIDNQTNMNYIDVFTQDNVQRQHQFSQEFQLVGDAWDRIEYVAGLFYFEEGSHEAIASAFAGGALVDSWRVKAAATSAAVYGQAKWTPAMFADRLGLTLGMRYTEDTREATKTYLNPGFTPDLTGIVLTGDRDFESFNPAVIVDYRITDTIRGYAKYSTGYRAGGFNTQSTPAYFAPGFDEEDVESWEVGLKSDLFGNRLRVNVAAFDSEYTDLQVDQVRTPPIFTDTLNAGSAKVRGFELEATALLAQGLSANLFYAHLDADYESYVDNGVELESVRHMPNAPETQFGAGLEYAFPGTSIGNFVLNVDYRYQDESYANPMPYSLSPSYELWNARLELADIPAASGAFRIGVWARNLNDEIYRLSTTNLGMLSAQFGPPRSVGLDVIYEF